MRAGPRRLLLASIACISLPSSWVVGSDELERFRVIGDPERGRFFSMDCLRELLGERSARGALLSSSVPASDFPGNIREKLLTIERLCPESVRLSGASA